MISHGNYYHKDLRRTLDMLRFYRERFSAQSYDEVIQILLREYWRKLINRYFGIDRGRINSFAEKDRVEDREV